MQRPSPTNRERTFAEHEIIVSKTDLKGRITYVNDIFCKVGLYEEEDVLGQPHSIVRHPEMPRAVFHLLWQRIQNGEEIFAYVKNLAKNGDSYWVLAHVTPSRDLEGRIDGYHSNRRCPQRAALNQIEPLYRTLLEIENAQPDRKQGMQAAAARLQKILNDAGQSYDEFLFGLAA
ncbi:MAG: PAS domain-containing protein [Ferrovibrio sp.]|uniref:PAS domain-containing protein n=1 Tax=Ferrovibrio sp. TaxID=1917215 RepID=UPI0026163797|nr:PAS domain-containing protein [Ferrovibrio sp.]MCW0232781.1 PAS domain-containing protein [Ferrovibrio sp.]